MGWVWGPTLLWRPKRTGQQESKTLFHMATLLAHIPVLFWSPLLFENTITEQEQQDDM